MRFFPERPRWSITAAAVVAILVCVVVERFATVSAPFAPAAADPIAEARALVLKEIAPKVPGFAVAVAVDGRMVWSEGFGYTDLAAKKRVTATTRFRVGSIAKPFTAAGLMLLLERGQLDLDAPVRKYVPAFPEKHAVMTTRQLAGHLGGIRHYRGNEMLLNRPFPTVSSGLAIFQDEPLAAPPGTKYIYSTYGWTLISAAMESAARKEFLAFMDENVFRPLGMSHTRADHKDTADPDRTLFYLNDAAGRFVLAPTVDNSYKWAGGGFLSTAEDLVRFGSAHLQPGFLRAESLAMMFTPQKTSDGKPTDYGIGWRIMKDKSGHRVMLHTGGSVGGTSVLLVHPETRTVVGMACNHSRSPFAKENWEAIAELFTPLLAKPETGDRKRNSDRRNSDDPNRDSNFRWAHLTFLHESRRFAPTGRDLPALGSAQGKWVENR